MTQPPPPTSAKSHRTTAPSPRRFRDYIKQAYEEIAELMESVGLEARLHDLDVERRPLLLERALGPMKNLELGTLDVDLHDIDTPPGLELVVQGHQLRFAAF